MGFFVGAPFMLPEVIRNEVGKLESVAQDVQRRTAIKMFLLAAAAFALFLVIRKK
jgi:hypothetical protein